MKIRRLTLNGFKSFGEKTSMEFGDGVSSVVGPNGCGKSNVVDALRWCLGEQSAKHLRGGSMEDVIFNGSSAMAATGMAEVSIQFDASDSTGLPAEYRRFSEIEIGRRYFRDGSSEYLINRSPARLRDIKQLFADTGVGSHGYSIIEQGQVERLIIAKPAERRTIIEQVAGISKFKDQRRKAISDLETVSAQLLRVTDRLEEIGRQARSLKRQAGKAARYHKIKGRIRDLDLRLSAFDYKRLIEQTGASQREIAEAEDREQKLAANVAELTEKLESERLRQHELAETVDAKTEAYYSHERQMHRAEQELARLKDGRRNKMDASEEMEIRYEDFGRRLSQLSQSLTDNTELCGKEGEKLAELNLQLEALAGKEKTSQQARAEVVEQISAVQAEAAGCTRESVDLSARIEALEEKEGEIHARAGALAGELKSKELAVAEFAAEVAQAAREHGQLKLAHEQAQEVHESVRLKREELKRELSDLDRTLSIVRDELADKRSHLNSLKELAKNYEGYADGVRAVMLDSSGESRARIRGLLGDNISVDRYYEAALAAVLGSRLQYILVDDAEAAKDAIDYLRQSGAGRGAFAPPSLAGGSVPALPQAVADQAITRLTDVVTFPDGYRELGRTMLADVVVVRDLDAALALREQGHTEFTYVTQSGDMLDSHGVIFGGGQEEAEAGMIARQRQIRELQGEVDKAGAEFDRASGAHADLTRRALDLDKQFEDASVTVSNLAVDMARAASKFETERRHAEKLAQAVETTAKALAASQTELETTRESIRNLRDQHGRRMEQLEQADTKRERLGLRLGEIEDDIARLAAEITDWRVDQAGVAERLNRHKAEGERLARESEHITEQRASLERERTAALSEIETMGARIKELEASIVEEQHKHQGLADELRELKSELSSFAEKLRAQETAVSATQADQRKLTREIGEKRTRYNEIRLRVENIAQAVDERYALNIEEVLTELERPPEPVALEQEAEQAEQPQAAADGQPASAEGETGEDDDENVADEDYEPLSWDGFVPDDARKELRELREKLQKIGEVNPGALAEYEELTERIAFLEEQKADLENSAESLRGTIRKIRATTTRKFNETFDAINENFAKMFPRLFNGGRAALVKVEEDGEEDYGVDIDAQPPGMKLRRIHLLSGGQKAMTAIALILSIFMVKPSPFAVLDEVDAPLDDANIERFSKIVREMAEHSQVIMITHNTHTMAIAERLYGVTMQKPGLSTVVSVKLSDEEGEEPVLGAA